MTRMLASANGPEEAEILLAGGADMIDLTNPGPAALNTLAPDLIKAALARIAGRRPVSASAGELPMLPGLVAASVEAIAASGVDTVNVGLVSGGDPAGCIRQLAACAAKINLIAVFFAGESPDFSLLPLLRQTGFAGAMLCVRHETSGPLFDYCDMPGLNGFIERCQSLGLGAGLSGSLETPDIPRLLVLAPDWLGFGDSLRSQDGAIDPARLHAIRALIPRGHEPATQAVDYRLLSSRGPTLANPGDDTQVDLVFVENFVLPVFIGAYARERQAPQNVRFGVTASVMRTGRAAEDMRDVFSYDLITDGIRLLVGSGHVALAETLAERISAMVLNHPRVTKVVVRVEKLETGSGTVGVQIERTRSAARTIDRPVLPRLAEASGKP